MPVENQVQNGNKPYAGKLHLHQPLEAISKEIGIDILLRKSRIDVVNEIIALL